MSLTLYNDKAWGADLKAGTRVSLVRNSTSKKGDYI
jgi:hypothetical protein